MLLSSGLPALIKGNGLLTYSRLDGSQAESVLDVSCLSKEIK